MAALSLPKNCRKLVGVSLGTRFREVVQLQTVPTPRAKPRELLVRMRYAGINASDINWTAGRYLPSIQPPFDTGFEGLGQVVETRGETARGFVQGTPWFSCTPGRLASTRFCRTVERRSSLARTPRTSRC